MHKVTVAYPQDLSVKEQLVLPANKRNELWSNWVLPDAVVNKLTPTLYEYAQEAISKWGIKTEIYRMYFVAWMDGVGSKLQYYASVHFTLLNKDKALFIVDVPIDNKGNISGTPTFYRG